MKLKTNATDQTANGNRVMQDQDNVVYSINHQDIQTVAQETLMRDLNPIELKQVAGVLGDYVDWFGAIELAIQDALKNEK